MSLNTSIRRGEPWFDDGTIILSTIVESIGFRLHRSVLVRHSEIFRNMFEVPQPHADAEYYEGCQIVQMPDSCADLTHLIKALYDGADFQDRNIEDFFHLAGVLRLSNKYFIKHLREQAVAYLTRIWSFTLRGHDDMISRALESPLVGNLSYPYVHPLHVLNLAREANVDIIVPSALYFLSLYSLADLLRADHPKLMVDYPSKPSSELSLADIPVYTLMFQYRLDVAHEFIRQFGSNRTPGPSCSTAADCTRGFARFGSRLSRSWYMRSSALHYMAQASREINHEDTICRHCQRSFQEDVQSYREKVWNNLPSIIGLPSWEDMRTQQLATSID
ncbi:hypothetical protein BD779DRAFT_533356 [Infundibulicybe gibba]|nr:hypothetical protein BD779DRAFT_533356 [Infundibulicybe gibba]